jgi:UDP-N-acetylglucosamine--N-acetylmuramyl-(pentapeptide) pyrophosphoryl-undecaprenol N-acetylglucosamine transferase
MVARVCLVSGGTGGHLMPALVLARALRSAGHAPLLITEGRAIEREMLAREPHDFDEVDLPGSSCSRLRMPVWLWRATRHARAILRERRVDSVVSTGGRPSLPVGLAARSLGVPLFLLEQNAVLGRVNRWLRPLAERTYLGLPGPVAADDRRTLLTGTPLRREIYDVDAAAARRALGLRQDQPVVLVTGGSQGARSLNAIVPPALLGCRRPLQVLHLSGIGADQEVRRAYAVGDGSVAAIVRPMAMDMDRMLGAADLVVCRGGGTTIAELMAAGRAAVIVPYPYHRDRQQSHNAGVLAAQGAAIVIEEAELSPPALGAVVRGLLDAPGRLPAMAERARRLCAEDPTDLILADMQQHGGLQ